MLSQKKQNGRAMTIYDIAKEAGVSSSTVSRVLMDRGGVGPEKKARVMAVVQKYNFKPNALARGLAKARSNIIGVMAVDICNPYYGALFVECEKAARRAGYTIVLSNSDNRERDICLLEKMREQKVDAIIQIGGVVDDLISDMEYAEAVNQVMAEIPVIVTGKIDGTKCRMVQIDHTMAMDLLMEHLLSLGHKRIALVGGRMDVLSTYEKFMRYKQILRKNQIPFAPELVAEDGDYSKESGYELMNRMLDRNTVPTAVIAVNELVAAGAMRSIQEHGYKIPEDISLVSYDNTYIAELLSPRLTSIDYNYEELGTRLIATAVAGIEKRETELLQIMAPGLVIRESSGSCRNRREKPEEE